MPSERESVGWASSAGETGDEVLERLVWIEPGPEIRREGAHGNSSVSHLPPLGPDAVVDSPGHVDRDEVKSRSEQITSTPGVSTVPLETVATTQGGFSGAESGNVGRVDLGGDDGLGQPS